MKMKSILLLTVAVGCGLVAMLGVQQVLSGDRGSSVERVRVLVARVQIDPGVPLDQDNVAFREVAKDSVPEQAVTKLEEYEERALTTRVFANQVICVPQLGERGVFGATIDIPSGMRVVTIPVNSTGAHSGLMKPGDRVDVIATFQLQRPGLGNVTRTKTILEYIEVWATDSTRVGVEEAGKQGSAKDGVKNVSLLVNLKQANFLKLAESKGTIHLALRSKTDVAESDSTNLDENSLESLESMFDNENTKRRPPAVEEQADKTPEPPAAKPNFAEYLAQPAVETPAATSRPTWKVTIFAGADKVEENVELPESERPAVESSSAGSRQTGWVTGVGGFFGLPVKSR